MGYYMGLMWYHNSKIISTFTVYDQASGLSLNPNTCELLLVNNYIVTWVCNIPVRHCVTYLGVYIT